MAPAAPAHSRRDGPSVVALTEPVLGETIAEAPEREAQQLGGAGLHPTRLAQPLEQVAPLELVEVALEREAGLEVQLLLRSALRHAAHRRRHRLGVKHIGV